MKGVVAVVIVLVAAVIATVAQSGHEFPVYPSYYPHEIRIGTITADRAPDLLLASKIQAYVGQEPYFGATPPDSIRAVESLGSFVVVRVNPESSRAKDNTSACAAARAVATDMAGRHANFVVHPYPITPFHGDYLYHVDLADAAKKRLLGDSTGAGAPAMRGLKVRATGALAKSLVRPDWSAQGPSWDIEVDEVSAADLAAASTISMNGWLGPPWARKGWYQATLLLAPKVDDLHGHDRLQVDLHRLTTGAYADSVERINLERNIVKALANDCHAMVLGYTVKREYVSVEYSAGIENIGFDAIEGLNSPIFIRTVKLKDFPWNGWLSVGIATPPTAAWNPIGGFTDSFGRLMWSAVGDPALLPSPGDAGWILNRISDVQSKPSR
jgi:hypothetical protein